VCRGGCPIDPSLPLGVWPGRRATALVEGSGWQPGSAAAQYGGVPAFLPSSFARALLLLWFFLPPGC